MFRSNLTPGFSPAAKYAFALLTLASSASLSAQTYHIQDLDPLGEQNSFAYGINSLGEVVGGAYLNGSVEHPFLFSGGSMHDLGSLGSTISLAGSINSAGQVVGEYYKSAAARGAFLYSNGVMTDIGGLGGSLGSEAGSINSGGEIVGQSFDAANIPFAFRYKNGTMQKIPGLGEGNASAINDSGQVVGNAFIPSVGLPRAFINLGATTIDLGNGQASGISADGRVVGYSNPSLSSSIGWYYSNGARSSLGTLDGISSVAYGVNSSGEVVGSSEFVVGSNETHGIIWEAQKGQLTDLNTLVAGQLPGWTVVEAHAINENGWIAATIENSASRTYHAALITVVPEPASCALVGTGFALILQRGRSKGSNRSGHRSRRVLGLRL